MEAERKLLDFEFRIRGMLTKAQAEHAKISGYGELEYALNLFEAYQHNHMFEAYQHIGKMGALLREKEWLICRLYKCICGRIGASWRVLIGKAKVK